MRRIVVALFVVASACFPPPKAPVPVQRVEGFEVASALDGVSVAIKPASNVWWVIGVKNDTDGAMQVLWDLSSFVAKDGTSWGRLVPGVTKTFNLEKSYQPMLVPPHASATEQVVAEKAAQSFNGMILSDNTLSVSELIDGGRLNLTIETADGRKTWSAIVHEGGASKPDGAPFVCFIASNVVDGACFRDQASCEGARGDLEAGVEVGKCYEAAKVACLSYDQSDGTHRRACMPNAASCGAKREALKVEPGITGLTDCAETK